MIYEQEHEIEGEEMIEYKTFTGGIFETNCYALEAPEGWTPEPQDDEPFISDTLSLVERA